MSRDEKREAKAAAKADKVAKKEAKTADRKAAAEAFAKEQIANFEIYKKVKAKTADDLKAMIGEPLISAYFGGGGVTLFSKGFVQVKQGIGMKLEEPQKLIAIEYSADLSKKTGPGRVTAAVLTGGLSLATANRRGDSYLTIVTDKTTYVLHSEGSYAMELTGAKGLVARANVLLEAEKSTTDFEKTSLTIDIASQIQSLNELRISGALTEEEFSAAKARLLG